MKSYHVLKELAKHRVGSRKWMFWRGVALGIESVYDPAVTMKWAKMVEKVAK